MQPDRGKPGMGEANASSASGTKVPFHYQRIAQRYTPPPSRTALKSWLGWLLIAVLASVAYSRFYLHSDVQRPALSPTPVAQSDADAEMETDEAVDEPAPQSAAPPPAIAMTPPRQMDAQPSTAPLKAETRVKVTLGRDSRGNYSGIGAINGKNVNFLVDTGASAVSVPEKIARQIGLKKGAPLSMATAGGVVVNYATTLDSLSIGQIEIKKVMAVINPEMQEDFVLLGMTALALLHFSQQDGRLVLSYDPGENAAGASEPAAEEPERFKRSVKECMGMDKAIDQKTLNCLKGN